MHLVIAFTNFGPYHLARLRALGAALRNNGGRLTGYEIAAVESKYPWRTEALELNFTRKTLYPDRTLESIPGRECVQSAYQELVRDRPDAVAICGYARPESLSLLAWSERRNRPAILMSETQEIDHPRVWWKEAIKRRRVRRFEAALVGGPSHRDYLVKLGMPIDRIAIGYNAVDHDAFARNSDAARIDRTMRQVLPERPYFLTVNRFVPEKHLMELLDIYANYRSSLGINRAWDLVLVGDGPERSSLERRIKNLHLEPHVRLPGFLQTDALIPWYAHASAFVHPSRMEPWGLVVNEAAACGLPLLVSRRAGCAATLVPDMSDPLESSGLTFDPSDPGELLQSLNWMTNRTSEERARLGAQARQIAAAWGPERFAQGMLEALSFSRSQSGGRAAS
jgi:glycosyltransferase involved in cell wall biosynthesis